MATTESKRQRKQGYYGKRKLKLELIGADEHSQNVSVAHVPDLGKLEDHPVP
jgi:hypothetical protein